MLGLGCSVRSDGVCGIQIQAGPGGSTRIFLAAMWNCDEDTEVALLRRLFGQGSLKMGSSRPPDPYYPTGHLHALCYPRRKSHPKKGNGVGGEKKAG